MRTRVVIVDDDDVSRRGAAELLADRPEVEIAGVLTHTEALGWDSEWEGVDLALVDAADPDHEGDQFPGVAVVEHLRTYRADLTVIVVTGHFFDDAVRRRMRDAGADFFYFRYDLHKAEALYAAVLHPERARAGVPDVEDPESTFRLGVNPSSMVNEAVEFARSSGLAEEIGSRSGMRSRRWGHLRRDFNDVARLHTVNADGTLPERSQSEPSLLQIERFLAWATRIKGDRGNR